MNSTHHTALTDITIRMAINLWLQNATYATEIYGHISTWNTSLVTNMDLVVDRKYIAEGAQFNEDLSRWDTARVTSMQYLFYYAMSFNGSISTWNTSSVRNMFNMFGFASAFNGDLSQWDMLHRSMAM
jgi:surface protein